MMELVCQQVVELVSDYLGHHLVAEEQVRFEQHLLTCPPCTAYLAQMRALVEMSGEPRGDAPADLLAGVLPVFRRWRGQ
jgi:predicted anti-sigma-YlaC factor YlaD